MDRAGLRLERDYGRTVRFGLLLSPQMGQVARMSLPGLCLVVSIFLQTMAQTGLESIPVCLRMLLFILLPLFPNQTSSTNLPTGQAGIFAGTSSNGVYLTTNNGSSWFAVNTGLPANASINSLAVSGKNIFAGIYNAGIFLSMNNGTSWSYCGFKGSNIQSIAASDSIVFAGIENSISSGVFRSTDNGTTWNKTSLNNSDVGVLSVSHEGASSASGGMNIFAGNRGWFALSVHR